MKIGSVGPVAPGKRGYRTTEVSLIFQGSALARSVYACGLLAISVDSPEDSENLRRSQGYTFPILSDAQEDVIRRWDLVHLHGRRDGADISRPAEFLIDPSGKVRWLNLTKDFVVRARPQFRERLDALFCSIEALRCLYEM